MNLEHILRNVQLMQESAFSTSNQDFVLCYRSEMKIFGEVNAIYSVFS